MSTTVEALIGMPRQFEVGETLRFTETDSDFPSSAWTAVLVLNNGVAAATSIAGTTSGTGFAYVIPASTSLTPGTYQFSFHYTAIDPVTEKARGKTGSVDVLPNLATTATPSAAQAMVTMLEAALAAFGKGYSSFSSGGVSYTKANIAEYQEQLVFWKAQVIGEKRRAAALRGEDVSGRIDVQFVSGQ